MTLFASSRPDALPMTAHQMCVRRLLDQAGMSAPVSMPVMPLPPKRDQDPVLAVFTTGE